MVTVRALLLFALLCGAAHARVIFEAMEVPARVTTIHGKTVERDIYVGVFYESTAPEPRPLLVLNHGRAPTSAGFARVKVDEFAVAARWLAGFGFIVAVPVRIGYGRTGGEDVEFSGACARRNYPPVYKAAAVESLAVLEALRKRPDAAQDRAIVMGQSFGGATALTLASMRPAGVQAAINFAGGGGGNPATHPQDPCSKPALKRLFERYGRTARIPTLWIYSENDQFFGPKLPREWFDAFRAAGGKGEFQEFPPVGENGHLLFYRAPQLWQPRVRQFLESVGYKAPAR